MPVCFELVSIFIFKILDMVMDYFDFKSCYTYSINCHNIFTIAEVSISYKSK